MDRMKQLTENPEIMQSLREQVGFLLAAVIPWTALAAGCPVGDHGSAEADRMCQHLHTLAIACQRVVKLSIELRGMTRQTEATHAPSGDRSS